MAAIKTRQVINWHGEIMKRRQKIGVVTENNFGVQGASGDVAVLNTTLDIAGGIALACLHLEQNGKRRMSFSYLQKIIINASKTAELKTALDDDLYYLPRVGGVTTKRSYEDTLLAKALIVYVWKEYRKHVVRTESLIFDFETFCADWREKTGWTPPAPVATVPSGQVKRLHPVTEFYRRHPATGAKSVFVKAHMRGSREKAEEMLENAFGALGPE